MTGRSVPAGVRVGVHVEVRAAVRVGIGPSSVHVGVHAAVRPGIGSSSVHAVVRVGNGSSSVHVGVRVGNGSSSVHAVVRVGNGPSSVHAGVRVVSCGRACSLIHVVSCCSVGCRRLYYRDDSYHDLRLDCDGRYWTYHIWRSLLIRVRSVGCANRTCREPANMPNFCAG